MNGGHEASFATPGELAIGLGNAVDLERGDLLRKVRDTVAVMVKLEGQLRSLSASTLSMSSSSSLGSLSTSSRGSASSLSFTDIYGGGATGYPGYQYSSSEHVSQSVADLQRRVNKHLLDNTEQDRLYAEKLHQLQDGGYDRTQSTLSLSPRSSLSSLSTPTSSCDQALPNNDFMAALDDYNTFANNNTNRERVAPSAASQLRQQQLSNSKLEGYLPAAMSNSSIAAAPNLEEDDLECDDELRAVNQKLRDAGLLLDSTSPCIGGSASQLYESHKVNKLQHLQSMPNLSLYLQAQTVPNFEDNFLSQEESDDTLLHTPLRRPLLRPLTASTPVSVTDNLAGGYGNSDHIVKPSVSAHNNNCDRQQLLQALAANSCTVTDMSAVSAAAGDGSQSGGSSGARSGSMSAAVSDESVAGDSGVYEAYPKSSPDCPNTPQIQIKLRSVGGFQPY